MPKPAAISLVLCDSIYRDSNGKTALVGLFTDIVGHGFPLCHPQLSVYASVTEASPGARFKLEIVHAESEHCVVQLHGPPPSQTTPLTICDFNFEMKGLVFPEPGVYFARFWGNDHLILQRPFRVTERKRPSLERDPGGRS